jgi:hypothetical protein
MAIDAECHTENYKAAVEYPTQEECMDMAHRYNVTPFNRKEDVIGEDGKPQKTWIYYCRAVVG